MARGLLELSTLMVFALGSTYGSEEYCPSSSQISFMVKELPVLDVLRNPCNFSFQKGFSKYSEKELVTILEKLQIYSIVFSVHAGFVINMTILECCPAIRFSDVVPMPDTNNITGKEPIEVLQHFYVSFVNHTVELYFMIKQIELHDSSRKCEENCFSGAAKAIFRNMRKLLCLLDFYFYALKKEYYDIESIYRSVFQILHRRLPNQPICSKRRVKNCQMMHSVISLMDKLSDYANNFAFHSILRTIVQEDLEINV